MREILGRLLRTLRTPTPAKHYRNYFDGALDSLLIDSETISIVQVGANDGLTSDPVAPFFSAQSDRMKLVAIEPDPNAFAKLEAHYSGYHNVKCINGAVGPAGDLTFYRIAQEHWQAYRNRLAPGASASKMNPTAVTATSKQEVVERVANNTKLGFDEVENMLEKFTCESMSIASFLARVGWPPTFDVLVLGTNGFDGDMILDTVNDEVQPSIIYFKTKDISAQNSTLLDALFKFRGYHVVEWRHGCKCAFRVARPQ